MAQEPPSIQFQDESLEDARRMGRGPRMEPLLYETLRTKIQSQSTEATRVRLGPEIRPERMKRYILHIARELGVSVTVRHVPGGVIFWRSSEEDQAQARETAERLRGGQQARTRRRTRSRRRA